MNKSLFKSKTTGDLYEVLYVIHPRSVAHGEDVYACYRLSAHDGMPIGSRVWLAASEFIDADQERLKHVARREV